MYSYSQPYLLVQVRVQFPHSIVFMRPIKSLLVLVFARAFGNAVSAVRPWDRGWVGLYSGGGAYIWNDVSVSTCGGLIHGGAYIRVGL